MALTDKTIIDNETWNPGDTTAAEILIPTMNLRINDCHSANGRLEQEWMDQNTGKRYWVPVKRVYEL